MVITAYWQMDTAFRQKYLLPFE